MQGAMHILSAKEAAFYLEEGKEYSQAADVAAAVWEP